MIGVRIAEIAQVEGSSKYGYVPFQALTAVN